MTHRSDRHGGDPITRMAFEADHSMGSPCADFHNGPERTRSTQEAEDTSAVRSRLASKSLRVPRRCARVKALRPPGALRAVRCAQP